MPCGSPDLVRRLRFPALARPRLRRAIPPVSIPSHRPGPCPTPYRPPAAAAAADQRAAATRHRGRPPVCDSQPRRTSPGATRRQDSANRAAIHGLRRHLPGRRSRRKAPPRVPLGDPRCRNPPARTRRKARAECWRREPGPGQPGNRISRARAVGRLSLTHWRPLARRVPLFRLLGAIRPICPAGSLPPERYRVRRQGADAIAPGRDLDSGGAAGHAFHPPGLGTGRPVASTCSTCKLQSHAFRSRLSGPGLSIPPPADSQPYDYQFNVHQPYLGGWGFLGKLYAPIDRDSASLVLEGAFPFHQRPGHAARGVGIWLDSRPGAGVLPGPRPATRSSLTFPSGLRARRASLVPSGPDSRRPSCLRKCLALTEG